MIQEVQDERYELLFGDGIFGKKLDNDRITVSYIVTDGVRWKWCCKFHTFAGSVTSSSDQILLPSVTPQITTVSVHLMGVILSQLDSIKYFAPRLYSSQYRAVTARDYESIIQSIYPNTESVQWLVVKN